MASFLTGPAAKLVGAGMQAVGLGIPVGQTSAKVIDGLRDCGLPVPPKSWFKRRDSDAEEPQPRARDERPSRSVYDKLESHINGVLQVVRPAIELKKLVRESCCKSAERPRRARSRSPTTSVYYTPQKPSSSRPLDDRRSPSPKRRAAGGPGEREGRRGGGGADEGARCVSCSRSRPLLRLPCGRLICRKCEEAGDHESELNMPRTKNRQTTKSIPNPVAIIDLTQDSPSNTALRLSRVPTRNEEESDADYRDDDEIVIPLDDSTEDSDDLVEEQNVQKPTKSAIVINLEDTINLDETLSEKTGTKQSVLNGSPNKKGSLSCPICFESLADDNMTPMSTPCGHVYCLDCLKKVTQAKKKCALCQRSISLGKCIRLHI